MLTASLLLLLLVAASCLAQGQTPMGSEACSLQATTITCTCRPGLEVLTLTGSYGGAETLEVSGCTYVEFASEPDQKLSALSVSHTASVAFKKMASPLLRRLALVNISHLAFEGAIFHGTDLQTVLFDGVHITTLPSGVLTNVTKLQNVTFRDVHISAVEQGAVFIQMVGNSEFSILNSEVRGVDKAGIVLKDVANFTMLSSTLATVGDDALQLDATGSVSISGSLLQPTGRIKLSVPSGASFRFVDNDWQKTSVLELAQQLLFSGASTDVAGNTFSCTCEPGLDKVVGSQTAAPLLEKNRCDDGLCGAPVPMRVLASCGEQTKLQAACQAALPASPPPGVTVSPMAAQSPSPGVTVSPMAAQSPSPGTGSGSAAAAIALSVSTALFLAVPAASALAL